MSADFLGVGWLLPDNRSTDASLTLAVGEQAVRQSIEIILQTVKGERLMRPDFGCGIHDYVFAVNNAATRSQVVETVRDDLIRWEPRIDVLDVTADAYKDEPNTLHVGITYRVRSTNNVFNLVYPFFLAERELT